MKPNLEQDPAQAEASACLCLAARKAARAVTDLYDLVLSPAGIKVTQFILLKTIETAQRISQHELGIQLSVAPETLSRRLSAAKSSGWVEVPPGNHTREHFYSLTQAGRTQLHQAMPYWVRSQARLHACLGDADWEHALLVLQGLLAAAKQAETARLPNGPGSVTSNGSHITQELRQP